MSKELQEKADKVMQELKEALVPIKSEIENIHRNKANGRRI